MNDIINLPANFIGKEDRKKLESFGGHTIAHGRATRWHWGKDVDGSDVFEFYRGGEENVLIVCVSRDRQLDAFFAEDAAGKLLASGNLEHVFAELDAYFARIHDEEPDIS